MKRVRSKDGTELAVEVIGSGPPLVLVDGAFAGRSFGPMLELAKRLSGHATVMHYDRRGRGASGDTPPFARERELEDLAEVCALAERPPCVYATSSGSVLALRAAAAGVQMARLAVYEPPFSLDGTHVPNPPDFREQIVQLLGAGRRDDAVKLFMRVVGVPAFGVWFMRLLPNVWPHLRAAAHTLPYDFAALGDSQRGGPLPDELRVALQSIAVPTQVLVGGDSPPWMQHNAKVVESLVPGAQRRVIPGQTHTISAKALVPTLLELLANA
jgi:pimeloyl-ACP methyl ester carboxylesterase